MPCKTAGDNQMEILALFKMRIIRAGKPARERACSDAIVLPSCVCALDSKDMLGIKLVIWPICANLFGLSIDRCFSTRSLTPGNIRASNGRRSISALLIKMWY